MNERNISIGPNLKRVMREKKIKVKELAAATDVSETYISYIRSGKKQPSFDVLNRFAIALGVDLADLVKEANPIQLESNGYHIPVLGSIPAGVPIEAVEDIIGWEEIPRRWLDGGREYFALLVRGDSMYPEYKAGDVVVIRRQTTCDSGDDCAVMVNNQDATLKKVNLCEDGIELEAINQMYGKRKFNNRQVLTLPVSILGVVVELRRKKK